MSDYLKKHPTEVGAYLITIKTKQYKIAKHLDDYEIHRGEWSIFAKEADQYTGYQWMWIDTVYSRKYAVERLRSCISC